MCFLSDLYDYSNGEALEQKNYLFYGTVKTNLSISVLQTVQFIWLSVIPFISSHFLKYQPIEQNYEESYMNYYKINKLAY